MVGKTLRAPLLAANALLARVANKDLTRCVVQDGTGDVAGLVTAINRVLKALHDQCGELLAYSEEVRRAGQDRGLDPAVSARLAAFRRVVRLPERSPLEVPVMPPAASIRFAWFMLCAGASCCWHMDGGAASLMALIVSIVIFGSLVRVFLRASTLRGRAVWVVAVSLISLAGFGAIPQEFALLSAIILAMSIASLGVLLWHVPQAGPDDPRAVQRSLAGCGESKMQHVLGELVCEANRGFAQPLIWDSRNGNRIRGFRDQLHLVFELAERSS